ncbi:MFS-type transporter SLC18B1-like isoform X1 [Mercenaria mercenaria]|uniref:MFS-type transporter SLC18B1-like isoform X1 n=1 Tax=Mercenaria mercenaria TaxID=6596 RepID=UPI00234F2659|nr:MFS-type transporter SLC18B1-like isoform X1 [Mercenaria mercenaria]
MAASERTPLLVNSVEQKSPDPTTPKSPTGTAEFSFKRVDRRKKFILVSMGFVNFCASCCFSLLAPFFPIEASYKGASQSVVGLIFGVFELVIFISSPIFGNYISKIGCKFMFVSGIMVCGSCAILFGTLDKGPDGTMFIVMCFLCRSIEALGCSAFVTALFAILAHEFPDSVITVMGSLETFSGLGMMVGPPIGGALYEIGGYGLPFFVMGTVVILCGLLTTLVMPRIEGAKEKYTGSILTLFKSPLVIITWLNCIITSLSIGYFEPTLANHLQQFDLKTWIVGLMFLIAPAVYAFTAPVWGYIGDQKGIVRLMIGGGNLFAVLAWLLLGPAPFLTFIPNTLYINIISLSMIGLGIGCSLIPTFKALLIGANSLGLPNDLDTYGKVSGFFNSSFSFGAFFGPTIGGVMVEKFGFPWASTGIAWMLCFGGGLMLIYICVVPNLPKLPEETPLDTNINIENATVDNKILPSSDVETTLLNSNENKYTIDKETPVDQHAIQNKSDCEV